MEEPRIKGGSNGVVRSSHDAQCLNSKVYILNYGQINVNTFGLTIKSVSGINQAIFSLRSVFPLMYCFPIDAKKKPPGVTF